MDKKEFEALEKDALALRDTKAREEALRGIAELRSLRARLDREAEEVMRKASQGPARETTGFIESIRYYRRLKSKDTVAQRQAMAELQLKHEKEDQLIKQVGEKLKNPTYQEQVKSRFQSRKWSFRFLTLLLIAALVPVMAAAHSLGLSSGAVTLVVTAFIAAGYFYGMERFWRCPACDYRLPLNVKSGRSVAKECRRCGAKLS